MRLDGDHVSNLSRFIPGHVEDWVASGGGGRPSDVGTALDPSEVLGAGDDFLAHVAPLFEAHRAKPIEIEHLRQEGVGRIRTDARDAGADVRQAPCTGLGPPYGSGHRRMGNRTDARVSTDDEEPAVSSGPLV